MENPFTRSDPIWKIIVPLSMVDDGGTISKRKGEALLVVSRKVQIFGEIEGSDQKKTEVKPLEGCVFLSNSTAGNYSVAPETMEVVWHLPQWRLEELFNPVEDK